jgi:type IV pilus assembly protein PilQ
MMDTKLVLAMMVLLGVSVQVRAEDPNPLDTVVNSAKDKKFTGSPITLKLKDADINEVMRLIGEASGFNVVVSPGVSGKVTVSLEDVPWDQALDVVMTTMNLAAERSESVLRVMPRDVLIKEKQSLLDAEKIASQTAPRITRVFPISYSDLTQLSTLLNGFLSTAQSAGRSDQSASGLASIQIDQNTQSLIVRDTAEGVERVRKMIALLDVQTPQIMIEAKVIDASESFTHTIDGKFGINAGGSSLSINGATLAGAPTSGTGLAPSSSAQSAAEGLNAVKFGIGSTFSLNAVLDYSEAENKAKVISSPRLMVLSGKTANITQGSSIAITVTTNTAAGSQTATSFIPYNTSLSVTPRATNDGSVFMKLNLQRDVVQADANNATSIAPRNINTEVVVDSGNTLVLGGVQSTSESSGSRGFPFLRKIPLIGWLFGKESENADKNELMFFVTPKIVNAKKTSLGEGGASEPEQKPANL